MAAQHLRSGRWSATRAWIRPAWSPRRRALDEASLISQASIDLPRIVLPLSSFQKANRTGVALGGVLAPNAKWRREVVDFGRPQLESPSSATTLKNAAASHNCTWAELIRRGLDLDALECPDCGGRLRFVAAILLSSAIRRILRHLGLPSDPVALAPARAPPELYDAWAC